MKASAACTASGVPCWAWPQRGCRRLASDARRPQLLRQQRERLVEECPRLRLVDRRQAADVEIGQPLLRPVVRTAGAGMDGVGDELLAEAEHLQRMPLEALERRRGAIDQQPLRRAPDPQCRRVAQPLAG